MSLDHLVRPLQERLGIVRPRALAVLRLMTSSNVVSCSTGSSAGFAPLKILSTKVAAPIHVKVARSVRDQPSDGRIILGRINRREPLLCRTFRDGSQVRCYDAVESEDDRLGTQLRCGIECPLQVLRAPHVEKVSRDTERAR
jgi:hypothetical protein